MKNTTSFCKQNNSVFFSLIVLFLVLNWEKGKAQCLNPCPVSILSIGTGYDYANSLFYADWQPDQYWQVVSGPSTNGPYPKCATSWGSGAQQFNSINTCAIGIGGNFSVADGNYGANSCTSYSSPFIFERKFRICTNSNTTTSITLHIDQCNGDDEVREIELILPAGSIPLITTHSVCWEQLVSHSWTSPPISATDGIGILRITVANKWEKSGNWPNTSWNVPTTMNLHLSGFLTSSPAALYDNQHFGKVNSCSPAYVDLDNPKIIGNTCLPYPSTQGTFTITPYDVAPLNLPPFTTTISPVVPIISGVFTAGVGSYTITATDGFGCTATTVLHVFSSPNLTVTPAIQCINTNNPSTTGPITYSSSGGTGPFDFTLQPSSPLTSGPNTIWEGAGTYTIQVKDANGCTSTGVSVINEAHVHATTSDPNNEICIGDKINLIATGSPGTYQWVTVPGNIFIGNGSTLIGVAPPLGTITYQVTVTTTDNCTSTSTVTVIVHPLPVVTITSNNAICNPQYTATSNTGPATYSWGSNGSAGTIGNPFVIPYQVPPITSGYVNVFATDLFGCIGTANTNYVYNPFCCDQGLAFATNSHLFTSLYPPNQVYHGNTASQIIQHFNMGSSITTNDNIIMDGDIIIDVPITFLNCPNILLTYQTQIRLNPDVTLNIKSSTMKAFCYLMWKGIFANVPSEHVIINNSLIKDMSNGVEMVAGAQIDCEYSNFVNNMNGLLLRNAPSTYNSTGGCLIKGNNFNSDGTQLFYPSLLYKGEHGISIYTCRQAQVGIHSFATGDNNHFENLYNGIFIQPGSITTTETYDLFNNEFKNIKVNNLAPWESSIITNWVNWQHRGAAIYSHALNPQPTVSLPTHTANILYDADGISPFVEDCDKAVQLERTCAQIVNCQVKNTVLGFMFNNSWNQKYDIHNNAITNAFIGMEFKDNIGNSSVYNNSVSTSTSGIQNAWLYQMFPSGYKVKYFSNNNAGSLRFWQNSAFVNASSGIGISLENTSASTFIDRNIVHLDVQNPTQSNYLSSGIYMNNANGTRISGNYIQGNLTLLSTINNIDGMRISNSPGCQFICNHLKQTRLGMHVLSDCSTDKYNVSGNSFESHGNAIRFADLGTTGQFGKYIGSATMDNNNTFLNAALFPTPYNYGIYRFATILSLGGLKYYSNTLLLPFSSSNLSGMEYVINSATGSYICQSQYAMLAIPGSNNDIDLDEALDIIGDSISYPEFSDVAHWFDDRRLYEAIAGDESVLLSNSDLATFYGNLRLTTRTDEIRKIDSLMGSLSDSTANLDSTMFMQRLNEISILNSTIEGNNNVELNEKVVNEYYLKWIVGGIDALSATEQSNVEALAMSCPFVNGTAVYKARTIYEEINGGVDFDDWNICHNVGVFKTGNQENTMQIDPKILETITNDGFSLYPNPASNQLTIDYALNEGEEGKILMYDVLGRECMQIQLSNSINRVTLSVNTLHNGVYLFRYYKNNIPVKSGKWIKE